MVIVSMPRDRQKIGRELSEGLQGVVQGRMLRSILVIAAILTAALCIPSFGVIAGGVILTLGAALYGEMIRRVSRVDPDEVKPKWLSILFPRSLVKPILCVLMAAGTVVPLWGMNFGPSRSPHWSLLSALIATLAWILMPVAMLTAYGCDRHGRIGIKKSLILLTRQSFATVLALAIIPATLILLEILLGLALYIPGLLPFFALDYMPILGRAVFYQGIPFFHMIDFRNYPEDTFIEGYFSGLRHGYSLAAAIPASLSLSTRAGLNPDAIGFTPQLYGALRVLLTLAITTCLITGFAIQAIWIGAIASLEQKRPADAPRPVVT
jgi:hypothetical protein